MHKADPKLLMMFREVIHKGTISAASLSLHIPKGTISRGIKELEHQLGGVLLKRGPRNVTPTDLGLGLLTICDEIASLLTEADDVVGNMQKKLSGRLRIALPLSFGNVVIARTIKTFTQSYPEVRVEIEFTNRAIDVTQEPYDIAIHLGAVPNQDIPSIKIADISMGIYGANDYLKREGSPKNLQELSSHRMILLGQDFEKDLQVSIPNNKQASLPNFIINDVMVAFELMVAGMGIGILPDNFCKDSEQISQITRLEFGWQPKIVEATATYLNRNYLPVRVRAFLDILKKQFPVRSNNID